MSLERGERLALTALLRLPGPGRRLHSAAAPADADDFVTNDRWHPES